MEPVGGLGEMVDKGNSAAGANEKIAAENISLRRLMLLEAVGRLGSVQAAARENGITQPAATQSLATLSRKLGFPIFNRHHRGITLTASGRELHARATDILRRVEEALVRFGVDDPAAAIRKISGGQLRVLEAIRSRETLSDAATALGINQRTAKQAVRSLERHLGKPALGAGVGRERLRPEVKVLAGRLSLLAAEIDWAIYEVTHDVDRSARTVVLGVAPDPGTNALDPVIRGHVSSPSDSCIEIIEADQHELLAKLVIGEIDLVVGQITGEPMDGLTWEELLLTEYRIAARHGHPLVRATSASVQDLLSATWVLGARGSLRRAASDALFAKHERPTSTVITAAAPMMAHLLQITDSLALMTDQELARRAETLTAVPFKVVVPQVRIGMARRDAWDPAAHHTDLMQRLRETFR